MQLWRARDGVSQLFCGGVTYCQDADIVGDGLASERVVAVYREFAVFDVTDAKYFQLAAIVLKLDFGTDVVELGRDIGEVVGEHEFRLGFTEALGWAQADAHAIANRAALQCLGHFFDHLSVATLNKINR